MTREPGLPQFDGTEREQSQLAAVALLARLGYKYLTREEALALRGGKTSRTLLEDVLRSRLMEMNRIKYRGREHAFSAANIRRAAQALDEIPLTEGLLTATEKTYDLLRLGKSLEQTIEGDTKSFSLRYIDWENPANNVFHATSEYTVLRTNSAALCRLDVVCFVNGIPFVVIECKARHIELSEAIADLRSYQSADYAPELFRPVQIVIASNTGAAQYGTVGTPAPFWSVWRSRYEDDGAAAAGLLKNPLPSAERDAILTDFAPQTAQFTAVEQQGRMATEQDRLLYALCRPERLLELARGFILYDGSEKKIARYQQYDAVKKAMANILTGLPSSAPPAFALKSEAKPALDVIIGNPPYSGRQAAPLSLVVREERGEWPEKGKRAYSGGVIWHTQGSGKSLTMVMLANAIALSKQIANPRIVLVTDRTDLDEQIGETFRRCGLEPRRAASGAGLRDLIRDPRAGVVTTLVQKFQAVLNKGEIADESPEIFVLVDEAHRTQYGTLQVKMRQVFPNACYIAFTGTPLLKSEKSTAQKFGGLIDAYPMEQAVEDKAVVPLLYERRHVPQDVDRDQIDRWFERLFAGLTDAQKADLKRKYSRANYVLKTEQRLYEIAFDVWGHFQANWQGAGGFKAQLVAPNRHSALKLQNMLETLNESADRPVTSCVIITLDADEREGTEQADSVIPSEVAAFGKKIKEKYGTEEKYEKSVIGQFKHATTPEILIVVDKLLTGFDAPCNTVLYLARRLSHHTLLQAIARVNRLYPDKQYGYILDYEGILGELDHALNEYAALKGYDLADIERIIRPIKAALDALPQAYGDLLGLFTPIANTADEEEYETFLAPEDRRQEFYALLTGFSGHLKIALSAEVFHAETSPETIARYQNALKRFQKLRAAVRLRYADTVNMKDYEPQIAKLLNTYVSSEPAEILTPKPIDIFDREAMETALQDLKTPGSKADAISHTLKRVLIERMDEDPALHRKFSELIDATIKAFRDHLLSELDYLNQARAIRSQFMMQRGDDLPPLLQGNEVAQSYYRLLAERRDALFFEPDSPQAAAELSLTMESIIRSEAVIDWRNKPDIINRMRARIDDALFDLSEQKAVILNWAAWEEAVGEVMRVAKSRIG